VGINDAKGVSGNIEDSPFSLWPLLAGDNALPDSLTGDVTIAGYREHESKLVISHKNISTYEFMKAHVENGSIRDGDHIPPFYFPASDFSGPDIVFYIRIDSNIYPCFVQLKLRQVLEGSDIERALVTVSGNTIQGNLNKEHEKMQKDQVQEKSSRSTLSQQLQRLQDYCPTGAYISMVITYPAEAAKFQTVRPNPEPELEGLQRVSIIIDDNNFSHIFPDRHVKFLDNLKQLKRSFPDEQTEKWTKKSKAAMTVSATDPLQRDKIAKRSSSM